MKKMPSFQCDTSEPRALGWTRRGLALLVLAALTACSVAPPPLVLSGDDRVAVTQITDYLNGLQHFTAKFSQAGPDGYSEGYVWLQRPGKLRVEYVRPAPKLMLANHGRLLLVDRTTQATTSLRLSRTPLDILLAPQITLSGTVTITALQRQASGLQLSLIKTDAPGQGTLILRFTADPLALEGLTVVRDGQTTAFNLSDMNRDTLIDAARFEFNTPAP
jgi:outer membrane lipoprotein-sorting protein